MTKHSAVESPAVAFTTARESWLRARSQEIGEVLAEHDARLRLLLPSDLGDQWLIGALVATRLAADEARVQPVADSVAWLESLIPHGHRHDLGGMVREVRAALALTDEQALWSWNAEAWEELLFAWWWSDRRATVEQRQADDELVSRWGVRRRVTSSFTDPTCVPDRYGREFTSLTGYLAAEAEPLALLARAVLAESHIKDAVETSLAVSGNALQDAGHLAFLLEQQLQAVELRRWAEKCAGDASEVTEAFLLELSDVVGTYESDVLQPVSAALAECERRILDTADSRGRRAADAYLEEFLGCVGSPPQTPDGTLDSRTEQEAVDRSGRGETTWHTMRGTVPVWCHIVGSPQERAAALAFSGAASSAVVRVYADVGGPRQFSLFTDVDDADQSQDWYPDPGIEVRYARNNAIDLCELLAMARLGHARLEFLTPDPRGGFALLRSLRTEVSREDAAAWAYGALEGLCSLVPDPDDLADLIADAYEEQSQEDNDAFPGGEADSHSQAERQSAEYPSTPGEPSDPTLLTAASLPEHLLARVKAILRKAEDPAASAPESEAYLRKAAEIMAKYGIERAMLQDNEPASEQPQDRVVDVKAPWMRECKRLLASIAFEMRCQAVYPGGRANRDRVHLFGFAADLHAVHVLYASLRLQMLQGAEQANATHRPAREDSRSYKRSWMLGFIRAVTLRVGEAQRQVREETEHDRQRAGADTAEGRSVAVVLAGLSAAVSATVSSRYPKLGKARRTTFKGSGYWQGHADGQQAHIAGPSLEDEHR
ncbi:DUF2786 domain-containing protein [Streptomyces syringium]|uniref:DUF2786 domain-containing protein n=1 Tax=Streptomyces syringium TaxID=76729 RepID=UPI0034263FD3